MAKVVPPVMEISTGFFQHSSSKRVLCKSDGHGRRAGYVTLCYWPVIWIGKTWFAGTRAAFQYPNFRLYMTARFLAIVSSEMISVAVGWQIYALTHRPLDLGLVGLAQFAPGVVLFLIGGTYGRPASPAIDSADLLWRVRSLCRGSAGADLSWTVPRRGRSMRCCSPTAQCARLTDRPARRSCRNS